MVFCRPRLTNAERVVANGRMMEVARMKISEAGWQAERQDEINMKRRDSSRCSAALRPRGRKLADVSDDESMFPQSGIIDR